ncbi:hypothetical protein BKA64DRAFT_763377 [Cadophora sp. MPI-SDFR-AT-0126]|nr:hypothetical protein BKA64DRAFT_763377 [Leotiomycetes sp. MPI-SDFR-AT-0126]
MHLVFQVRWAQELSIYISPPSYPQSAQTYSHFSLLTFLHCYTMARSKAIMLSPLSTRVSLSELYERLGIRNAPGGTTAFSRQTRRWTKSYRTGRARLVPELNNWNNLDVQSDLQEVAEEFFKKYGQSYWSGDNTVRYTDDKDKIVDLLKQVFWKQSQHSRIAHRKIQAAKHTLSPEENSRCETPTMNQPSHCEDATTAISHRAYSAPVAQMMNSLPSTLRPDPTSPPLIQLPVKSHPSNTQPLYSAAKPAFWIITNKPKQTQELWPGGNLQQQSLSDFIQAIPILKEMSKLLRIQLTLETAKRNIVIPILIGDEALWKFAKTYLAQKLDEVEGVEDWSSVQIELIYDDNVDAESLMIKGLLEAGRECGSNLSRKWFMLTLTMLRRYQFLERSSFG